MRSRQGDEGGGGACWCEVVTIDGREQETSEGKWRGREVQSGGGDLGGGCGAAGVRRAEGGGGSGTANETNDDQSHDNSNDTSDSFYHKALCATCGTPVGVRDEDEVYHLFDVFPTNA